MLSKKCTRLNNIQVLYDKTGNDPLFWKELFLLLVCWKQLHEWVFHLV